MHDLKEGFREHTCYKHHPKGLQGENRTLWRERDLGKDLSVEAASWSWFFWKESSTTVLKTRALSELKSGERLTAASKENGGEDGRLYAQQLQMDSTSSYHFKSQIWDSHWVQK